jgi:Ca2+-binding RTX toxin-like protein
MLFLIGIVGMMAAGFAILGPIDGDYDPLEEDAQETDASSGAADAMQEMLDIGAADPSPVPDASGPHQGASAADTGDHIVEPDVAETDDAPPLSDDPARDIVPPDGPDLEDQVYGQNMGDALGGNLFTKLFFSDHAQTGVSGNDTLDGGSGPDLILGNEGDDHIAGHDGSDMLIGDSGNDTLMGGAGQDIIRGGDGHDVLDGGDGDDLMTGGEGDDDLIGGAGDDQLFGQLGNDTLNGGAGNDFIDGTHGATTAPAWTDADDADLIFGGDGDDILVLGAGDIASGGAGADLFATGFYGAEAVIPVITDFDSVSDELQLIYDSVHYSSPVITTQTTDTGLDVLLNGAAVAHLSGVSSLSTDLIRLLPVSSA